MQYDGSIWEDSDPDKPVPVDDTHPYCKCTLEDFAEPDDTSKTPA